jgi:hypothetical protein
MQINQKQLTTVVAIEGDNEIIATGPLTKQPYTKPNRLVIRVVHYGNPRMVVCREYIKPTDSTNGPTGDHELFGSAQRYFDLDELPAAMEFFATALKSESNSVGSIYRDFTPDA